MKSVPPLRFTRLRLLLLLLLTAGTNTLSASAQSTTPPAIRASIEKSLPLLTSSAAQSAERRSCFTCHHQALPMLTLVEARHQGFSIEESVLQGQVTHTTTHLQRGLENYLTGSGQGGRADTAGSALWALEKTGYNRDPLTEAVASFLVRWNDDTPYWSPQSDRPPTEGSRFTSTFLALRGLAAYGTAQQQDAITRRRTAARDWLVATPPATTEDSVFRLHALVLAAADDRHRADAARHLSGLQRGDGGWAQLPGAESDAYATGSALVALHDAGEIPTSSEVYTRGLEFLLQSQQADGSWHVVSRSVPIQDLYDSGFPHGKDQFISAAATAWATRALLRASPSNAQSSSVSHSSQLLLTPAP
jgi:N-acyl-D-amino-acid deacylase